MASLVRNAIKLVTHLGAANQIVILNYHRVLAESDPMLPNEPDAKHFERQLKWLTNYFNVISLDEALSNLEENKSIDPQIVLTFDDGYRNNAEIALPLLKKYGVNASFFIVTDELDGGIMWNDTIIEAIRRTSLNNLEIELSGKTFNYRITSNRSRRKCADEICRIVKYYSIEERGEFVSSFADKLGVKQLPTDLMMTSEQIKLLTAEGMIVGAHACKHDVLTSMTESSAKNQICDAKIKLEKLLDHPVDYYAFPNGKPGKDYYPAHVDMVKKAGYKAALSTCWGGARQGISLYELPRIMPWRASRPGFVFNLLQSYISFGK